MTGHNFIYIFLIVNHIREKCPIGVEKLYLDEKYIFSKSHETFSFGFIELRFQSETKKN